MAEFHQTGMGRAFFEGTLPKIATALQAIAQELKTANDQVRQAQAGKPVEVSPAYSGDREQ